MFGPPKNNGVVMSGASSVVPSPFASCGWNPVRSIVPTNMPVSVPVSFSP